MHTGTLTLCITGLLLKIFSGRYELELKHKPRAVYKSACFVAAAEVLEFLRH